MLRMNLTGLIALSSVLLSTFTFAQEAEEAAFANELSIKMNSAEKANQLKIGGKGYVLIESIRTVGAMVVGSTASPYSLAAHGKHLNTRRVLKVDGQSHYFFNGAYRPLPNKQYSGIRYYREATEKEIAVFNEAFPSLKSALNGSDYNIRASSVDIDGDNTADAFIRVESAEICGSWIGCPYVAVTPRPSGYKVLGKGFGKEFLTFPLMKKEDHIRRLVVEMMGPYGMEGLYYDRETDQLVHEYWDGPYLPASWMKNGVNTDAAFQQALCALETRCMPASVDFAGTSLGAMSMDRDRLALTGDFVYERLSPDINAASLDWESGHWRDSKKNEKAAFRYLKDPEWQLDSFNVLMERTADRSLFYSKSSDFAVSAMGLPLTRSGFYALSYYLGVKNVESLISKGTIWGIKFPKTYMGAMMERVYFLNDRNIAQPVLQEQSQWLNLRPLNTQ